MEEGFANSSILMPDPHAPRPIIFTRCLSLPQPGRANQHNIHLSIAGSMPGRPAHSQRSLRGTREGRARAHRKGCSLPCSHLGHSSERGPLRS